MTRPVGAALVSFTEIEAGQHHKFHEWHRSDHLPEQLMAVGVVGAERLVATPALRARRSPVESPLAATQYFTYYLHSHPIAKSFQGQRELGARLHAEGGRDFGGPNYRWLGQTASYRLLHMYSAPKVVSAPAVMPFRPHQGVFVTVHDPNAGTLVRDVKGDYARHEQSRVPALMDLPGVAGCWSFEAFPQWWEGFALPPARRALRVYWLDGDPTVFADALEESTLATVSEEDLGAYSTVFTSCYRFVAPDSEGDWFDGQ